MVSSRGLEGISRGATATALSVLETLRVKEDIGNGRLYCKTVLKSVLCYFYSRCEEFPALTVSKHYAIVVLCLQMIL